VPLVSKSALVVAGLAALLTGCPGEQFASCSGPQITHPEGKCTARYYQADYGSSGQTTQALVECAVSPARPGGNVVAFHSLEHGIGLKWLDPHTLEVATPTSVRLESKREFDTYGGYALRYVYRELTEGEPAYRGCGLAATQSGT
jgi:hypothetical protein